MTKSLRVVVLLAIFCASAFFASATDAEACRRCCRRIVRCCPQPVCQPCYVQPACQPCCEPQICCQPQGCAAPSCYPPSSCAPSGCYSMAPTACVPPAAVGAGSWPQQRRTCSEACKHCTYGFRACRAKDPTSPEHWELCCALFPCAYDCIHGTDTSQPINDDQAYSLCIHAGNTSEDCCITFDQAVACDFDHEPIP